VDAHGIIKIWNISTTEPTLVDNNPTVTAVVSRKE